MLLTLSLTICALGELSIDQSNSPKNYCNEVLYIQLTRIISTTQKYSTDPLEATFLNCSLFSLISILFSLASFSFSLTSLDIFLIVASTSISSVSSSSDPCALASLLSSCYSYDCRVLVFSVTSSCS